MAPLLNDPIILVRLKRLFRHLKHQNLSTGDGFIHSSGTIFLVSFLATREAVLPLENNPIISGISIQLFIEYQNLFIISDSIGWCNNSSGGVGGEVRGFGGAQLCILKDVTVLC